MRLECEINKEKHEKDLIEGGGEVAVTIENRGRYLQLCSDYVLRKSIEASVADFKAGFWEAFPQHLAPLISSQDIIM